MLDLYVEKGKKELNWKNFKNKKISYIDIKKKKKKFFCQTEWCATSNNHRNCGVIPFFFVSWRHNLHTLDAIGLHFSLKVHNMYVDPFLIVKKKTQSYLTDPSIYGNLLPILLQEHMFFLVYHQKEQQLPLKFFFFKFYCYWLQFWKKKSTKTEFFPMFFEWNWMNRCVHQREFPTKWWKF